MERERKKVVDISKGSRHKEKHQAATLVISSGMFILLDVFVETPE